MKDDVESIWIGPIGPIPILADDDPKLVAGRESVRIAQAAIECVDLIELVLRHPDPTVRMEAVPRLKARFPNDTSSQHALILALKDQDEGVRCEAISALADLAMPGVGDLLAAALSDPEPDVRFFAAIGLHPPVESHQPLRIAIASARQDLEEPALRGTILGEDDDPALGPLVVRPDILVQPRKQRLDLGISS